jgi:hypothetical protein
MIANLSSREINPHIRIPARHPYGTRTNFSAKLYDVREIRMMAPPGTAVAGDITVTSSDSLRCLIGMYVYSWLS